MRMQSSGPDLLMSTILANPPLSAAPALSVLHAPTATEGLRLAQTLAGELHRTWLQSHPPGKDMASHLRNDGADQVSPGMLTAIQFSLIAAANNYWRP
jgi:hypothetical protein